MSEKENLGQQQNVPQAIGGWVRFLLNRNSTLELLIKGVLLLVVVSWIESHYLSWKKQDAEQEKFHEGWESYRASGQWNRVHGVSFL